MKIVIDIPENYYNACKLWQEQGIAQVAETIIANGNPYEEKTGEWLDYIEDGYVECPFCESATSCESDGEDLHYCYSCGANLKLPKRECANCKYYGFESWCADCHDYSCWSFIHIRNDVGTDKEAENEVN